MFPNSQEKSGIRNYHIDKLREFERESRTTGKKIVYGYGLQCLQEEYERISKNKAPIFDLEYELKFSLSDSSLSRVPSLKFKRL